MSSTKRPRPVSSAGSSRRATRAPKCFAPMVGVPELRNAAADDTPKALHCNRSRSYVGADQRSKAWTMLDISGDARRSARSGDGPPLDFQAASRRARGAGPAGARRPADQQGHRAASAGALAVPGRPRRGRSAARSCSPTWSTAAAAATTCRSWSARSRPRRASMRVGMGRPVEEIERGLDRRDRPSDRAGRGRRRRRARRS